MVKKPAVRQAFICSSSCVASTKLVRYPKNRSTPEKPSRSSNTKLVRYPKNRPSPDCSASTKLVRPSPEKPSPRSATTKLVRYPKNRPSPDCSASTKLARPSYKALLPIENWLPKKGQLLSSLHADCTQSHNLFYSQDPNPTLRIMSNPGYFTQEGMSGREADSNNNCQPDPQAGPKKERMEESQTGSGQTVTSQASSGTNKSSYATAPADSSSSDSSSSDNSPSDAFSSPSSSSDMEVDQAVTTIKWYTPWHVDPWNWKPAISPRTGTIPNLANPRGQPPIPLHQRKDPRHRQLRKLPIEIPFFRMDGSDKRIQDPHQWRECTEANNCSIGLPAAQLL